MKKGQSFKSAISILLTVVMLFSMLSVGAFSVAADDVAKFTADFHQLTEDLKVNGNPTFPNFGGVLTIDAATEPGTQTWQGFVNDYLNSRWESRTSYGETLTRRWVCQQNSDLVTDGRTNHRFALSIDNLRYHIADIGGVEMIRRVDSLVFKADEKIAQFKNFEAELDFSLENSSDICGSMLFNFHESNPGHFVVKTADTAVHTGNTLVIGNPGKNGVDSWGFYPSTMETIPNKTIEDDDAPALEKGLGVTWSSFSQYYTLKVRAVNGTATFTLTSGADPTYIKTYTVSYPADGFGAISLGHSNRSVRYNNITLTELDNNGDPVDYGTFTEIAEAAANATKFTADFHQLTEDLKVNGNPTFPNFGGVLTIDAATEPGTQTWQGFVNDYLNSRWESRTSYGETLTRRWVCQQNSDLVTDGRTNHRFALSIDNLRYHIADVGGVEMIRRVDSLVFKADEKIAQFKNFEAELDFSLENSSDICGSMLFNFHESNPGHFVVKTADTAVHTGNTLVIGNPGKTGVDSWGFYPSTMETIPNKTIEDDDAPALEKGLGVTWSSFSQYYTLKVRAVNGTATFTLTSGADPTYIKTYTVTYPADGFGAISLGHSNRSVRYNNITLTELDDQGMPVNYGSFDPCANGHKFTKYVPNNDATCEKLPTETATCDYGCGTPDTRNVEGGAYGEHVVDAYTPNNDATCEKLPTETGTCTVCGDPVTRDVEGGQLADHIVETYTPNNDGSCFKLPTETGTCTVCGDPVTRDVEGGQLADHIVETYTPNNDGSCFKLPTETGTCTVCEQPVTRDVEGGELLDHTYDNDGDAVCNVEGCGHTRQVKKGWIKESGKWYFYENGVTVKNDWRKDSTGWVYLGADGAMVTNKWLKDSKGWCFVGDDGYCLTNTWKKDSTGWTYLGADCRTVVSDWVKDNGKWYYMNANGYMVTGWQKISNKWYYFETSGVMAANCWKKDSKGWVKLGDNGAMLVNKWTTDSKGWCYVGADGYAVTNTWKKDSKGWIYLNSNGSMTKSKWVKDSGKWYYCDANGYMVASKTMTINGKKYTFNASGVCLNP